MSIEVGSIIEGVVTGITHFGAFIELPNGQTGLVHISEVANTYVKDINEFLKKQDKVKVKVLSVDNSGKIGLSIKQAEKGYRKGGGVKANAATFEDKLARFLKKAMNAYKI